MKYYVFPIIEGCNTGISLSTEAVPLDDALKQITGRMARQCLVRHL